MYDYPKTIKVGTLTFKMHGEPTTMSREEQNAIRQFDVDFQYQASFRIRDKRYGMLDCFMEMEHHIGENPEFEFHYGITDESVDRKVPWRCNIDGECKNREDLGIRYELENGYPWITSHQYTCCDEQAGLDACVNMAKQTMKDFRACNR